MSSIQIKKVFLDDLNIKVKLLYCRFKLKNTGVDVKLLPS